MGEKLFQSARCHWFSWETNFFFFYSKKIKVNGSLKKLFAQYDGWSRTLSWRPWTYDRKSNVFFRWIRRCARAVTQVWLINNETLSYKPDAALNVIERLWAFSVSFIDHQWYLSSTSSKKLAFSSPNRALINYQIKVKEQKKITILTRTQLPKQYKHLHTIERVEQNIASLESMLPHRLVLHYSVQSNVAAGI